MPNNLKLAKGSLEELRGSCLAPRACTGHSRKGHFAKILHCCDLARLVCLDLPTVTGHFAQSSIDDFMLQFQFTMFNMLQREFGRYLQLAMLPLRLLLAFLLAGRVGKTVYPHKHTYTHAQTYGFCFDVS